MARRKYKRFISKYENDAVLINSTIINFEYKNKEVGERFKNVFFLKSTKFPETGRLSILWGRCSANIGDEVICKGRIDEQGTFLCWSMMIKKQGQSSA